MTDRPALTESELVELVRSSDVRAPDSLHRSVQELVADRSPAGRRAPGLGPRATPRGLAVATALAAAAVIALVAGLSGGGSSGPTLPEASALTLRPATAPAPRESSGNRGELAASVDGVSFPYWRDRFGWRSTGTRSDRVKGRTVTTVFYADAAGRRVGYTIVAGVQSRPPTSGVANQRDGTIYRVLSQDGATVVTWLRDRRLCVVSGRGVDSATLLRLASWGDSSAHASPA